MPLIRNGLRAVAAVVALLLYVWWAAVRGLPLIKRRKAARRSSSPRV
jgi:hypothetical protein